MGGREDGWKRGGRNMEGRTTHREVLSVGEDEVVVLARPFVQGKLGVKFEDEALAGERGRREAGR